MIATICPGSTAWAAGAVTWASTLPTHTAMPSGSPVQRGGLGGQEPARAPSAPIGWATFSSAKPAKPGFRAAR